MKFVKKLATGVEFCTGALLGGASLVRVNRIPGLDQLFASSADPGSDVTLALFEEVAPKEFLVVAWVAGATSFASHSVAAGCLTASEYLEIKWLNTAALCVESSALVSGAASLLFSILSEDTSGVVVSAFSVLVSVGQLINGWHSRKAFSGSGQVMAALQADPETPWLPRVLKTFTPWSRDAGVKSKGAGAGDRNCEEQPGEDQSLEGQPGGDRDEAAGDREDAAVLPGLGWTDLPCTII